MDQLSPADGAHVARATVARAARDGYGRLVALIAAASGDVATAEDVLGDALERALGAWADQGVPDNPHAWLLTVARNRLRDRWREAEARRTTPLDPAFHTPHHLDAIDPDAVGDKRLELLLVCAHPAIAPASRTPLMLNTVLGFTAQQIAPVFAMPTTTMATRLTRAKRRIKAMRIPFEAPDRADLEARMDAVREAVYGAYVIEWSLAGPQPRSVPPEALRLAEVLAELAADDAEARGLAALVLLSAARSPAVRDEHGRFIPLGQQDPAKWNTAYIERAHVHLRAAYARQDPGRFQIEAAIQALHCTADRATPDWHALRRLHTRLYKIAPSRGSATALAAVTAETDGPEAGLAMLDELSIDPAPYQPAWAARASLLARLRQRDEATAAYDKAIDLTHDTAQRTYLIHQRDRLHPSL